MSYNQRKVEIIPPKQVFLFDTHVVIKKFQDAGTPNSILLINSMH